MKGHKISDARVIGEFPGVCYSTNMRKSLNHVVRFKKCNQFLIQSLKWLVSSISVSNRVYASALKRVLREGILQTPRCSSPITLTLALTLNLTLTLTLTLTHSLSLARSLTHTHSLTHSLTPSHSLSLTLTHSHSLTHALTHSLPLTHSPVHAHTYPHTQTHSPSPLHHSHTSSSLLAFYAQSKSREVGNMWSYPVLQLFCLFLVLLVGFLVAPLSARPRSESVLKRGEDLFLPLKDCDHVYFVEQGHGLKYATWNHLIHLSVVCWQSVFRLKLPATAVRVGTATRDNHVHPVVLELHHTVDVQCYAIRSQAVPLSNILHDVYNYVYGFFTKGIRWYVNI